MIACAYLLSENGVYVIVLTAYISELRYFSEQRHVFT